MFLASSLRSTLAKSIRREVAGDPQSANVKMRTGPNIGAIAGAIGGVGLVYWIFMKKESDVTDQNATAEKLESGTAMRDHLSGGSVMESGKQVHK